MTDQRIEYRDKLMEQVRDVNLDQEIRQLEGYLRLDTHAARVLEQQALTRADIEREIGWGDPGYGRMSGQPDDYYQGQCRPLYENELDLQEMRSIGRHAVSFDETGACIMANIRNYVIGEGFKVEALARDKQDSALAMEVQAFADEFLDYNDWTDDGETEALTSAVRDGEVLLWLRPRGAHAPKLRMVHGEHLAEPGSPRAVEDFIGMPGLEWRFGVAADHGASDAIHGYFIDNYNADWEFAPEAEAVFIKRNTPSVCKRGVSDFAIPFKAMGYGSKLFERTMLGATIQASIAYVIKAMEKTPAGALGNLLGSQANVRQQTVPTPHGPDSVTRESFMGGKVIRTTSDYQAGPMGSPQGPVYLDILQGCYRRVGSRWCMPEYMISGDASNANYASTMVAESPFVQQVRHEQGVLARKERELLWKAISMAARHGRFRGLTSSEIRAAVELKIVPPNPETRDDLKQEQVLDAQQRAGVLSRKTRAALSGLDYDEEIANGAKQETPASPVAMAEADRVRRIRFSLLEGSHARRD